MILPQSRAVSPRVTLVARLLLLSTAVLVAVIVFTPGPPDEAGQRALAAWLEHMHQGWLPGWVSFGLIEFLSNVIMFFPLGLLGAMSLTGRRWIAVPVCAAVSCTIELVQWIGLPARDGSWLDVVANLTGGLLGYLTAVAVLHRRPSTQIALPGDAP